MPSITFWTRLEPYARLQEIDLGLQAQIHDPLWLLARQWQNGEFEAEDSGTPVQARLRLLKAPLARYFPGSVGDAQLLEGQPYRAEIPLEVLVEREPAQAAADPRRDLRMAAEAGLYFLGLLDQSGAPPALRKDWLAEAAYRLAASPDDPAAGLDPAGQAYLRVMAGRAPDGYLLYQALRASLRPQQGEPGLPPRPQTPPGQRARVIQAGLAYLDWFERRCGVTSQPEATVSPTWNPERLEYAFTISAAAGDRELALEAPEYPGGTLDWYSFDYYPQLRLGVGQDDPQPETVVRTLLPSPVRYPGAASDRWWEFEDSGVNFNRIEGDPDELMRLLLVQFALVYSNDWYMLPVDLSPGAVYRPSSLVVTDAFGERTLIQHYSAIDRSPRDWRLFVPSLPQKPSFTTSANPAGNLFFLPPVLAASLHGDPIEEVMLMRDELANVVWAIEQLAPGLAGGAINRVDLYARRHPPGSEGEEETTGEAPDAGSAWRYNLANTVPDHWIPFLPVRIDPSLPDIRLRRAAALLEQADPSAANLPAFSRPLGRLLEPQQQDFGLFEEEVPSSGVRVIRQYQYARWVDGATFLWLARAKSPAKGETSAGLRFDEVEEV